jgi:ubiquinone/menaquinone biosynthesis C-methylase UbiE
MSAGEDREVDRLRRVYAEYDRMRRGATAWSPENPGNRMIVAERRRMTDAVLRRHRLGPGSGGVLEIGCGSGDFLDDLLTLGFAPGDLHAVDLLESKVEAARARHPHLDIRQANAEQIPLADAAFQLVVMATVVSSIFDPRMAAGVAGEAARVLKPGGAVLWYDMRYDNPGNRHVHAVTRADLETLFPGFAMDLRPVTVLPLLARRLGRATAGLYPLLAAVGPLQTHLIGLLTKPGDGDPESRE